MQDQLLINENNMENWTRVEALKYSKSLIFIVTRFLLRHHIYHQIYPFSNWKML